MALRILRSLRLALVGLAVSSFSLRLAAQNTVNLNPDCVIAFNITAANGTGPAGGTWFDNRQIGCNSWQLQYGVAGSPPVPFASVALTIQFSTDGTTSAGTLGGTAVYGSLPLTSVTGASALINSYGANFPPYVHVIATTLTGGGTSSSLRGVLLGYRTAGTAGTSGSGTGPAGSSCPLQAAINLSASGNTRIINAAGVGTVRICHISFSTTAAEDIQITEGTGTNCGTGTANVSGPYKSVQSIALDPQITAPIAAQVVGDDICLNQSMALTLGGIVIYSKN